MMKTGVLPPPSRAKLAFSLVELSIVLVILGLLVGGVLSGRSLIKAAELRTIPADYQRFEVAMKAFRDKYFYYPGDMPNATQFWGTDAGCPTSTWDGVAKTVTCNGNGDGMIYDIYKGGTVGTALANLSEAAEMFRAWQQLANAGLIEGKYVGASNGDWGGLPWVPSLGLNIPTSKIANAGWQLQNNANSPTLFPLIYWNAGYQNVYNFGTNSGGGMDGMAISGPDAFNIDTKMDDGRPGYGNVTDYINAGSGHTCNTTDVQSTAAYVLTDETIRCNLVFKMK